MKNRNVIRTLAVGVVVLFSVLVAFMGVEIFSAVFPDNAIVITAANGANLRVNGGALEVLGGSAGTISFAPSLRPAAGILFAVLVAFALVGAASLAAYDKRTAL